MLDATSGEHAVEARADAALREDREDHRVEHQRVNTRQKNLAEEAHNHALRRSTSTGTRASARAGARAGASAGCQSWSRRRLRVAFRDARQGAQVHVVREAATAQQQWEAEGVKCEKKRAEM